VTTAELIRQLQAIDPEGESNIILNCPDGSGVFSVDYLFQTKSVKEDRDNTITVVNKTTIVGTY